MLCAGPQWALQTEACAAVAVLARRSLALQVCHMAILAAQMALLGRPGSVAQYLALD